MESKVVGLKEERFDWMKAVYVDRIFMLIMISLYSLIMIYLFKIPAVTMGLFLFYTIVLIILPGVAILSLLKFKVSWFMMLCLSYAIGYAVNIGEYFVSEVFDRKVSFSCLSLVVGLGSLGIVLSQFVLSKEHVLKKDSGDSRLIFQELFFALFLFTNVFAYAAKYLGTDVNGVSSISRDMQYWCNNSVALKIQFPAETLFMDGVPLFYHYFSSIQIAYFSSVSGIDIFTLSFPLYSMVKTFILVGAVIFMMNMLCKDDRYKIVGMLLALCTTGLEDVVNVTFLQETWLMPFGFDVGFAYGCYFATLLVQQWKAKKFVLSSWILTSLFWAVCVGGKAPIASILIVLPAMLCLYWLIKKEWKLSLIYGGSILGIFLVINIVCTGVISVFRGTSTWPPLSLYTIQDIKTWVGGGKLI